MPRTIVQKVKFSTDAGTLYRMYMDSGKHTEATGGKARLANRAGGAMSAWDGYIKGKMLVLKPKRMITQTWRASNWKKDVMDSILTLLFEPAGTGCEVHLTHAGVPEDEFASLKQGWTDHYWKPWKLYLKARAK